MDGFDKEDMILHDIMGIEFYLKAILPWCSWKAGKRVSECVGIVDLKDIKVPSVGTFLSKSKGRKMKESGGEGGKVKRENYPEILGSYYFVNAPLKFRCLYA